MSNPKSNKTTFAKGRSKTGGRKPGEPNKSTKIIREALLVATEAAGNKKGRDGMVSYLTWAATKQPASYLALLGRLLPQQLETNHKPQTNVVYRSVAEIRQELILRGVPPEVLPELLAPADDNPDEEQS